MPDRPRLSAAQWLMAVGIALALSGAFLAWRHLRPPAPALPASGQLPAATLINDKQPLPAFVLRRHKGTLTNADLAGHWTFLDFGYTYCPDICPTTLATLKEITTQIAAHQAPMPQVVFVSVDPARDTPARLDEYVHFFDPAFIGATGSDTDLAGITKYLGIYYERHEGADPQHYTVDHSAVVFLIDPQGRLKATFSWPHEPVRMVADYLQITSSP